MENNIDIFEDNDGLVATEELDVQKNVSIEEADEKIACSEETKEIDEYVEVEENWGYSEEGLNLEHYTKDKYPEEVDNPDEFDFDLEGLEEQESLKVSEENLNTEQVQKESKIEKISTDEIEVPLTNPKSSKSKSSAGYVTIVNSPKNGRRLSISKEPLVELGWNLETKLEAIVLEFIADGIVLSLDENRDRKFNLRKQGAKHIIYSKDLVNEVTDRFDLDFSDRVSITFTQGNLVELPDGRLAFKVIVK